MCGIIAIVRRRGARPVPSADDLLLPVAALAGDLAAQRGDSAALCEVLVTAAAAVRDVDARLRPSAGVRALLAAPVLATELESMLAAVEVEVSRLEGELDGGRTAVGADLEQVNEAVIALKDATWAVRRDRLRTVRAVAELAGPGPSEAAVDAYLSVQQALSAIDRLEVRGRDSAGLHLLVRGHGLDLGAPVVARALEERRRDPLFASLSVRAAGDLLSFVYKAAAEIGELGDNTRALRAAITADELLRQALSAPGAEAVVLGHTRWASVGIISQPNAHPLNSEEVGDGAGPYVTAVLNGDVDNFADLKAHDGLRVATEITTDAKVIPTLTSRLLASGADPTDAFRRTVARLEGSVAIGASLAVAPEDLFLALRGSGQALYVGMAEDAFVVASEPYGVVEDTDRYLRMDGDTPADPENPTATRGQVIRLRGERAGDLAGVERWAYDGTPLPVAAEELARAQITTRDIDRGDHPHFLLKEVTEAPASFRKTLRGKLVEGDGGLAVRLGPDTLPAAVRAGLADGSISRVVATGQGTAFVAAQALAAALGTTCGRRLEATASLATELSGFDLSGDMSDTLVVAISQSGTTTDTNRTVDLVRSRGASVVAVVNRRNSDLTDKADGVLYTSDGRDVEMAVPSTKAFYAQIAAGWLLAVAVSDAVGRAESFDEQALLAGLRDLPDLMVRTLATRPEAAEAAQRFAPSRRYWAVVGNGANRVAAAEVRIKISELCYKSIACDATEDKKHIDLSSEPLILVCAAGLTGSTADDVAKEIAIYRAHKAAPVVVASEGDERFDGALQVISVPSTHPALAFVLSAMVGHLFGYEAALAIDTQARPLREARAAVEAVTSQRPEPTPGGPVDDLLARLSGPLQGPAVRFVDGLRRGDYDGHLEASSAVRLASMFRFALGVTPLEGYQLEWGRVGTPSVVVEDLTAALTDAIEQLTRPVDAIKHQAKTVTVGISRSDETLLQAGLAQAVLAAGASRDRLSYGSLRTLAVLDPLVAEVLGYTRYRIEGRVGPASPTAGGVADEPARVVVIDRGGIGRELRSRTEDNPVLRGTKHRVASERTVLLARGRADDRTVLIVPEVKDNQATGLTLLHVRLHPSLPLPALRTLLQGYRDRFQALHDAVTETEPTFRDDLLVDVPLVELMTAPINDLADRWRTAG